MLRLFLSCYKNTLVTMLAIFEDTYGPYTATVNPNAQLWSTGKPRTRQYLGNIRMVDTLL